MNEITFPVQSNSTIVKASLFALSFASIIFVSFILPAEYNIDPLGIGKRLGLTQLAGDVAVDSNTSLNSGALINDNLKLNSDVKANLPSYQENEVTVIVPSNKGIEYKFTINQYGNINYEWSTNGEPIYFDFHGEPKGDTTGYFESYSIATTSEMRGTMTVPFDGVHGWYWKNNSNQPITVTLKTKGNYQVVGLIH